MISHVHDLASESKLGQLSISSNFITLITISWCIGFFSCFLSEVGWTGQGWWKQGHEKADDLVTKVTRCYKPLQIFWNAFHKSVISASCASHLQKTKLQKQFFCQTLNFPYTSFLWWKNYDWRTLWSILFIWQYVYQSVNTENIMNLQKKQDKIYIYTQNIFRAVRFLLWLAPQKLNLLSLSWGVFHLWQETQPLNTFFIYQAHCIFICFSIAILALKESLQWAQF